MGSSMSTRMKHRKSQRREDTQSSEPQQKSNTIDSSRASSTNGSASTKTRNYHNVPNSTYWFPNDDEEMDRLISQHFAIKSLFNGNIVDKAFPLLPTPFEEGAKVLDVGCGPGTWLMDIATEYPQVDCLGVDMCDVFPKQIRPPNVRFEVANVTDGLPYPDNTFDFVNVRLLLIGLQSKQWPEMWKEVMRVLKPGGLAQSIEAGMLLEGTPLVNKAGQAFIDMMKARDQEPFVSRKMDKLMEATGYKIIHFEIKDICLSQKDALTQEFASDIVHIFRGVQHVIGKALNIKDEEYPQFLEDLRKGMSEKPDAMWSYSVCLGQKPH